VRASVQTAHGVYTVDLDDEEVVGLDAQARLPNPSAPPETGLPLVVAAAAAGSTIVAVVDRRPPLVVSNDAGRTWREAGGGLPRGRAVAIAPEDPDVVLYAARNRLYLSTDGGTLWRALAPELPEIEALGLE
jgi:hypothetical protein